MQRIRGALRSRRRRTPSHPVEEVATTGVHDAPPAPAALPGPPHDPRLDVDQTMLRDPALQDRLRDVGVVVVRGVVPTEIIGELRRIYASASDSYRGPRPTSWYPTGALEDAAMNRAVYRDATIAADAALQPLLVPGAGIVHSGSFAVKPVGEASKLGMHQDVSTVDERRWYSVNAWIPLVDSVAENGALAFVAGSHRFGNIQRSLAMPWAFEGLHEPMERHAQLVPIGVGDLILFDTGVIHGSPANLSNAERVALQVLVLPAHCSFEHLRIDGSTPPGDVDVYQIDPSAMLSGDGTGPVAPGAVPTRRPYLAGVPDPAAFAAWCARSEALAIT